jgi:S-(hydroxymethyl)glutathione dehydrogenase/alcohol dehydrogenase
MKAAVCYEFGKPLVVEEVNIDPPKEGEVKVRLAATAICHSDIHNIRGDWGGNLPLVPGHESSGYVEEIGKNVTSVKPGAAVITSPNASCGRCHYCLYGLPHLCEAKWVLDTETRLSNKRGQRLGNNLKMANFAEYVILHESQLVQIPEMPMDAASLLACGFTTGFGAVVNRAQVKPFSSVVVIGTGGVGLSSVQGALFSGAYPIIAVDISDYKLKAARDFGATHTVKAGREDAAAAVRKLTSGKGADYVFVTVGSGEAIRQSFSLAGVRGTIVIVGIPPLKEMGLPLPLFDLTLSEKMVTGTKGGSIRGSTDIPQIVALYKAGRIKLDELITGRYTLDQINEAIESSERGEALRNVIIF